MEGGGEEDMKTETLFSSAKCEWETPLYLFEQLNKEFNFTLDVCALPENAKVENYYTPQLDGLRQDWSGVCWMNPPYGRDISKWMSKAVDSWRNGSTVVCLVPARTDTRWWHEYVVPYAEVRFIRGRIKFSGARNNAPFPSAIIIYRGVK